MRGCFQAVETTTFQCNRCSHELRKPTKAFCQSVNVYMQETGHYSLHELLQPRCEVVCTTDSLCPNPDHQFPPKEEIQAIHSECEQRTVYSGQFDQMLVLFNSPQDMEAPTVDLPRILAANDQRALFPDLLPDALYGLAGIIVHENGHYYSYRHHQDARGQWTWLEFDDSVVTPHLGSSIYLGPRIALYQRLSEVEARSDSRWAQPEEDVLGHNPESSFM